METKKRKVLTNMEERKIDKKVIIIILLLVLVAFLIYKLKIGEIDYYQNPVPTGNVDVFDIGLQCCWCNDDDDNPVPGVPDLVPDKGNNKGIHCGNNHGIHFWGPGLALIWNEDGKFIGENQSSHFTKNSECFKVPANELSGAEKFTLKEMEVYQVIFENN